MSYDLFLTPREPCSRGDFGAYFRAKHGYQLSEAGNQAFFENEDTGTYFSFDWRDEAERPIAFNMNYFRPHVFGLEAAPHVDAVVAHFGCTVDDPQMHGMGSPGTWSQEGFLRGWDEGNRFGYDALLRAVADEKATVASVLASNGCFRAPAADIRSAWEWNIRRRRMQVEHGEQIFIPRIMWGHFAPTDSVVRLVVWGGGVPIVIPRAITHVIVMKMPTPQPPAPAARGGLFGFMRRKSEPAPPAPSAAIGHLVPAQDILSLGAAGPAELAGQPAVRIPHGPEALPAEVQARFDAFAIEKGTLGLFSGGQARDHELIEAAMAAGR